MRLLCLYDCRRTGEEMPYRRVIKTIIEKVMQAKGEGAMEWGRLGGSGHCRTEELSAEVFRFRLSVRT